MSQTKNKKYGWVSAIAFCALVSMPVLAQQDLPTNTEAGQLADAIAQTAGEYDAMNLSYIQSFGMQQKAWNDPLSHLGEGQTKPGYSKYVWSPDVVLPVRLREGMMTLINLPTWELIEKVHIGSPESFGGEIAAPNSLLVYADPNYIGVDSNMIIFGRSGNRYVFYLRSETYNTDKITHSVVDVLTGPKFTPQSEGGNLADFNGATATAAGAGAGNASSGAPGWAGKGSSLTPGGAQNPQVGLNTASTGPKDWLQSIPVDPEKFRFDVEMYLPNPADVDIAPERVWRDDIFTYIDLGPKALTMVQRPVVNMIVQDSEVPVGFRTRGEYSRLIVVEGVGDMVLRNGRKIVCLKLRRDPAMGLENTDYSGSEKALNNWNAPAMPGYENVSEVSPYETEKTSTNGLIDVAVASDTMVNGQEVVQTVEQNVSLGQLNAQAQVNQDLIYLNSQLGGQNAGLYSSSVYTQEMEPMRPIPTAVKQAPIASAGIVNVIEQVSSNPRRQVPSIVTEEETISIELAAHPEISELESVWEKVIADNKDVLAGYEPYYSIDATADGDVRELFRLRVGPMIDVKSADAVCQRLGRRGYSCSVIRVQ